MAVWTLIFFVSSALVYRNTMGIDILPPTPTTPPRPSPQTNIMDRIIKLETELNKIQPQLTNMIAQHITQAKDIQDLETDVKDLSNKLQASNAKIQNQELEILKLKLQLQSQATNVQRHETDIAALEKLVQKGGGSVATTTTNNAITVLSSNTDALKKKQEETTKLLKGLTTLVAQNLGKISHLENAKPSMVRVHQFAWTQQIGMDQGTIKTIQYVKKSPTSGLRMTYTGNLCIHNQVDPAVCSRWWFEINGHECNNPEPIDAVRYTYSESTRLSLYIPVEFGGICNGVPVGKNKIELKVGACINQKAKLADACTGSGSSSSRIIVEEIPYDLEP